VAAITSPRDGGFTLSEVMVTIVVLGILMAIAITGWSSWAKVSAHSGAAREIQAVMTQAHQRAITEGTAICVWFDVADDSYSVYRGACDDAGKARILGPYRTESGGVLIAAPAFGSEGAAGVTLRARGTADAGSVKLQRTGSTKEYVLTVEGLTSRVTIS
jgi:prepilin-type N-terminal cleavage/methylation domain-containing protein